MPGPNTFPTSTMTLSSLQDANTPSLLDIRPWLNQISQGQQSPIGMILERIQQAIDNIQQTLRTSSPSLDYLQIDSADISSLYVGGQFGPGQFAVGNGPPNYDNIGWIGSQDSAAPVTITSIVGGLVTTAAVHKLKPGDNVYIQGTTGPLNTGYYVVATTPLTTTYTVTGGVAGGNSTGGTSTKQFQGIWSKTAAFGGTEFDTAPLKIDVDGTLSISNALISLITADGHYQIILDPAFASATLGSTVNGENELFIQNGILTARPHGGVSPSATFEQQGVFVNNISGIVGSFFTDQTTNSGQLMLSNSLLALKIHLDGNSGNADAVSYSVSGSPGATASFIVPNPGIGTNGLSVTTTFLQYKDWSGANQGINVVTAVTLSVLSHAATNGIVTL